MTSERNQPGGPSGAPTYAPGTVLQRRLEVVRTLFGGMGEVIIARNRLDGRLLALKTFPDEVFAIPEAKARFMKEADTWLRLGRSDFFVELERVVEIDGKPFLQMPYCEGGDLRQRLVHGPLAPSEALFVATRLLLALRVLNDANKIVHRDVKPSNVLFGPQGPLLSDLGIVRWLQDTRVASTKEAHRPRATSFTQHGVFLGTLPYASPEQILDSAMVGTPSDVWSFAVVTIETLTGCLPFVGPTPEALAEGILSGEAGNWPAVDRIASPSLRKVLRKCLAPRADQRFSTFTELCEAWDDVIRLPSSPSQTGWLSRDRRVPLDDGLICHVWEELFPARAAAGTTTIVNDGDINRVKEILSFHALRQYDRVRQEAHRLLGNPGEPESYFHKLLANTLETHPVLRKVPTRDPAGTKLFLLLSREIVVQVLSVWMRALIDWLGEHETQTTDRVALDGAVRELQQLAQQLATGRRMEHDLLVHAGQGLVMSGDYDQGERLLSHLAQTHPDDLRVWCALLLSATRRGATARFRKLAQRVLDQKKETSDPVWQVFFASIYSQIGDARQSVRWALQAHASNPRDLEALYHVCLGLGALGRRGEAEQYFLRMTRLNPTALRTRQVGERLGAHRKE